jgi:hypothetical protein
MVDVSANGYSPKDGFTLKEGNIRTIILVSSHGDLLIRQQQPGKKPVFVSSYSDSGLSVYALLIKFLATQGHSRPRIAGEKNSLKDKAMFDEAAVSEAQTANIRSFPYWFQNESIDARSTAHIMKNGSLDIEVEAKHLVLSPALVHALAENIPKMFPDSLPYRLLAAKIRRSSLRISPKSFRAENPEYRVRRASTQRKGRRGR